jgi:hypothetical protein
MSLNDGDVFVILRWPADAGPPRYSFATVVHAKELQMPVERVQTCSTIEAAASLVDRLNEADDEEAAA